MKKITFIFLLIFSNSVFAVNWYKYDGNYHAHTWYPYIGSSNYVYTTGDEATTAACTKLGSLMPGYTVTYSAYAKCSVVRTLDSVVFWTETVYLNQADDYCLAGKIWNNVTAECEIIASFYLSKLDKVSKQTDANINSCTYTNNPINTTNGNKTRQENDFNSSGISPLKFTRYYNSQKNQGSTLGTNWSHSYTTSLTTNIHTAAVPYVADDPNFSSLNSTAQLACEAGWNDIRATYNKPELDDSTAVYLNSSCNIQNANGQALGSIAVRDNSSGGTTPTPPQDNIVIERANGNVITFTLINSVWTGPLDSDVTLVKTDTGYTFTTAQDTVEEYNLEGQLVSSIDAKGIQLTFTYDPTTQQLESVTDSFGSSLGFAYIGSKLTTVTLPDATILTYGYDANNNFASVKREDNSIKTYIYDDIRFPNALTGIIDENLQRYMTFTYDALGRAKTSELGDGVALSAEKVTLDFIDDNTSTVTDALGQLRTYRFAMINGEKKLTDIEGGACASCGGGSTKTTYDANGYVETQTDFNGVVTSYVNNTRGLVTTLTEAVATKDERVTTYTWHPQYALPTCVIESARTTAMAYTPNGSLETRRVFDTSNSTLFATPTSKTCETITARADVATLNQRLTAYTYTPNYGLLETIDGPRTDVNDVTTFGYDVNHRLSSITNALGHVTELKHYTLRGQPQTLIDANGLTTRITYDVRGRVDIVTVGSQVTDYDFDAVGHLDIVTRPDGSFINYDYDAAHRLTDIRDQLGNHIHYELDALGNITQTDIKDATGTLKRTSRAVYNQLSQLDKTIGAALQTTNYVLYDGNGNLKHLQDAEGKSTLMSYDALNRLETTKNALLDTTTNVYDAQNNIVSVTDLRGLNTTYQYDGLGNRTQQNSPDTGMTHYTAHDGAGNVLSMVNAKNQTTTYAYDALNRIDLITYDDGTQADYAYDLNLNDKGRLSSVSSLNAIGTELNSVSWAYDQYGRVSSKTEVINDVTLTTSYVYNAITGLLESQTTPANHVLGYTYTHAQVTSITVDSQVLINNITYDPFGVVKGWHWGNGLVSSRVYDLDGQLDKYTLGSTEFDNDYTLAGNVQTVTDLTTPTNLHTFNYDALHRLHNYTSALGTTLEDETYDYDASSNRSTKTDNLSFLTDTYVTDALSNKLSNISGHTNVSYTYDANGNITSKLDAEGVGHRYGLNAQNRMSSITVSALVKGKLVGAVTERAVRGLAQRVSKTTSASFNGELTLVGTVTEYAHNGLGQRVSKTRHARSTLFGYGPQGELTGVYHADGTAQEEIIYFAGAPVGTIRGANLFYIHTDHLGTPRRITDNTNAVMWSWLSDPFGTTQPTETKVGKGKTAYNFTFNLRFAGQYYDAESGLHYNYFRDYDPATGRYVQSDPIGLAGGLNTYGYVGGNPLMRTDPTGEAWILLPWFFGAGGGATTGGLTASQAVMGGVITGTALSMTGDSCKTCKNDTLRNPNVFAVSDQVDGLNAATGTPAVPWADRNKGKWTAICRVVDQSINGAPNGRSCGFGFGIANDMVTARKQAEKMAKGILGSNNVHHPSCKCVGPKGQTVPNCGRR